MSRTVGAFVAIVLVFLAVSLTAQTQAPATGPAAPIPAGLPEWAYTPPAHGRFLASPHGTSLSRKRLVPHGFRYVITSLQS